MPPRVLFVADTHCHHQATLTARLSLKRPFATIEEHDEMLIANSTATAARHLEAVAVIVAFLPASTAS